MDYGWHGRLARASESTGETPVPPNAAKPPAVMFANSALPH